MNDKWYMNTRQLYMRGISDRWYKYNFLLGNAVLLAIVCLLFYFQSQCSITLFFSEFRFILKPAGLNTSCLVPINSIRYTFCYIFK